MALHLHYLVRWATSTTPAYCFGWSFQEWVESLADLTALEVTHDSDVQNILGLLRNLVLICGPWSDSLSTFSPTTALCKLWVPLPNPLADRRRRRLLFQLHLVPTVKASPSQPPYYL
jgi:hypothetical protein